MSKYQWLVKTTVKGTLWIYGTYIVGKGLVFVSTIILARILAPDDFGLLALGLTTINYLDALSDLGVGEAYIYRQENFEKTANNAFGISVGTGILLSVLAFLAAPYVGDFYREPRVVPLVQVLAIKFLFSSLGSIHGAMLKKEMDFRRRFFPEITRAFVKGGVSIFMAWQGFGVWSLVWGQLSGEATSTLIYWWVTKWKPRFAFDLHIAKGLLGYGSQMILVGLLGIIHNNMDYLIIGRRMDAEALGFYTMAFRLPELVVINICYIVSRALFPAYAKIQDDPEALREGFLATLRYITLITIPAGVGIFLISPEFVELFYTDQWLPAVPAMQVLALSASIYSLSFNAGDIYKATGRPHILIWLSLVYFPITIPILWYAAGISFYHVALGFLIINIIQVMIKLVIISRVISLRLSSIVGAIRPSLLSSGVMFLGAYSLRGIIDPLPLIIQILILVVCGIVLFAGALYLLDRHLLFDALSFLKSKDTDEESQPPEASID